MKFPDPSAWPSSNRVRRAALAPPSFSKVAQITECLTGLNTAELSGRRRGVVVHEAVLVLPNPGHAGVVALRGGLDAEHTVAVLIRCVKEGGETGHVAESRREARLYTRQQQRLSNSVGAKLEARSTTETRLASSHGGGCSQQSRTDRQQQCHPDATAMTRCPKEPPHHRLLQGSGAGNGPRDTDLI